MRGTMRENWRPDEPGSADQRIARHAACEKAVADRKQRFPELSDANASEALDYQESRIQFHLSRTTEAR